MKKMTCIFIAMAAVAVLSGCRDAEEEKGPVFGGRSETTYQNPVYRADVPDPSVIRARNGKYYVYGTTGTVLSSPDLVEWTDEGKVFPTGETPSWLSGGAVWACDINYVNGCYVLFYALSKWGEEHKNGIGVATSLTPEGPFRDTGALFTSDEIGVQNSIDPCYFEEDGRKYLAWGSFHGIFLAELTENGLRLSKTPDLRRIAGDAFEGAMLFKKDGKYYLFASIGSCCNGEASTYRTVVGRSDHLAGPYLARDGGRMLDNACTVILSGTDRFRGTGHNSELVTDGAGDTWLLYHAYDVNNINLGRCLFLDKVQWDSDGWPFVEGGTPSSTPRSGHQGLRMNGIACHENQ